MPHHPAGRNSDVVTLLSRLSQPPRSILTCSLGNRFVWPKVASLAVILIASSLQLPSTVMAQTGRASTSSLADDEASDRVDRANLRRPSGSKDLMSRARQVGAIDEAAESQQDAAPKTPFELDEPLYAVNIVGNTTIPKTEIAKHIKSRPDRPVTQRQIKEDVDALIRTRWFANVETKYRQTDDGPILEFRVLERPIVRRVEYKGLKKVKQKIFDNLTQLKPGSPFDVAGNRECARRIEEYYHDKGYAFATVELEKGNDRDDREVVFLIDEGPCVKVTGVKFHGNKEFISGILKTKTHTKTQILWVFGGKYDPSSIKDDIEGVKQYYHGLGFFDVEIKEKLKFSKDRSRVEIQYDIAEGTRYKIRNVEIVGNKKLTDDQIHEMMKVAKGTHYNEREINKDVDAIRTKYGEQGRLKCRVDAVPRWTEQEGIVDLEYRIDEDKVYRVRNINVNIQGDHPHTRTNLVRNISPVQPGDLADPKQLHLMKRRLEGSQNFETGQEGGVRIDTNIVQSDSWIASPNYKTARSQSADGNAPRSASKPPINPARKSAAQGAVIPDNSQPNSLYGLQGWVGSRASKEESRDPLVSVAAHFDSIPTPATSRMMAQAEAPVEDDGLSPLTPIFRAQSQEPLQPPANYGFDVSPQGDPLAGGIRNPDPDMFVDEAPGWVDIDAYLTEARTGRLMFGVGVNSDAGLVGNIVLSEQNFNILRPPTSLQDIYNGKAFRGGGQKFKIEAMPGTQVSRYMVDWQDPYFMDSNYNLGVSGFYFTRYYRNWYENRFGGRVRVGRQLTRKWSGSLALRLEDVDLYNPTVPSPQILKDAVGTSLLSTVRGSLIHDTRDAAFNASEGHYFEMAYEQAFGQFTYPRLEVEGRQYFTTYQRVDGQGKHTVMVRGQAAWSGNDTPIFERFFAGGFQTFRGFAFRGVSPVDTGVYTGGNFMVLGGAEYQLPVTANEMVKVVGFTDFGTVNDSASLSNFRMSVGAGVRVTVPMMGPVPIAIDFAIPVLKDASDIQQVISFYVGASR